MLLDADRGNDRPGLFPGAWKIGDWFRVTKNQSARQRPDEGAVARYLFGPASKGGKFSKTNGLHR
jgi:hypothetical protein